MESRIGWLGGSYSGEQTVDETLLSVDTYTGEEVRLTSEQLVAVKAHEQADSDFMKELMDWLGVETVEAAEAFLADLNLQDELQ
jgi:hypothetical protein